MLWLSALVATKVIIKTAITNGMIIHGASTRGLRLVLSHTARDPDPPVWRPRCSQGGDTASMLPVDVQAKLYLATGISDGQRGIGMLQGTRNLLPGPIISAIKVC